MERMKKICMLCVVLACVAPAMAVIEWVGGVSNDFANPANWSAYPDPDPNPGTDILNIQTGAGNPNISSDISWDIAVRFKGKSGSQTAGNAEFITAQAGFPGLIVFKTCTFDVSGGSYTNWGQVGLGNSDGNAGDVNGTGWINLSGTGSVTLLRPKYTTLTRTGLVISAGSGITLAGDSTLIVDDSQADVSALITAGLIKGANGEQLQTTTIYKDITVIDPTLPEGDPGRDIDLTISCTQVSIVPEPATLVLLGLGTIAAFRRKR